MLLERASGFIPQVPTTCFWAMLRTWQEYFHTLPYVLKLTVARVPAPHTNKVEIADDHAVYPPRTIVSPDAAPPMDDERPACGRHIVCI